MPPSYDDVLQAFARIRADGGVWWDARHPLRDFELAAQSADIRRSAARLAAYRLGGQAAPLGYYDEMIDALHVAIEMLERQREIDHGGAAPFTRRHGEPADSLAMRARVEREIGEVRS